MRPTLLSFFLISSVGVAGCGDDSPPSGSTTCTEDAQCDDGIFCNGSETCAPETAGASSLGCVAGVNPCIATNGTCIETESTCDESCAMPDGDGDGIDRIECGGNDCDDMDASRYPGNTEICDTEGHDEDCDPDTVGSLDRDRDGFIDSRCTNEGGASGADCNDLEVAVRPSAGEICNGRDDDCDGDVDEGVTIGGFVDGDADGRGDSARAMFACAGAARFAIEGEDCDDADITIQPVQNEICDSKDNDCDGTVDEGARPVIWYADSDGDGYGDVDGIRLVQCTPPAGYSILPTDCDDLDAAVGPLAEEACNGIDDDCNGAADFLVAGSGLEDDDGDGIADAACGGGDCDDLDPFVGTGLPEVCNGRDDDCDGMSDEGITESDYFVDVDGDGYGAGVAMPMCADLPGIVPRDGDCNDSDPGTTLNAVERCDNVDNDCDGTVDEGAADSCVGENASYICLDGFCEIASCTGTYGDCDFRASNGCETDLAVTATNVAHCGVCGGRCDDCQAGECPGSGVFLSAAGTVTMVDGTPAANVPVFVPRSAPLISTTASGTGFFSIGLLAPAPYAVGGGNCYPTLYSTTGGSGPFSEGGNPIPLDPTELELVQGETSIQQPNLGMVAIVATGQQPVPAAAAVLNLPAEGPVGFSAPFSQPRPLVLETSTLLGGYEVDVLIFSNVEPGPLDVNVEGCTITVNPGYVTPGVLTIVGVDCAAIG